MTVLESRTKIVTWGNSKGMRIPKKVLDDLNITENQELRISVQNNSIVLTPLQTTPKDIHELFAGWKDDGVRGTELDWGASKGEELDW